jgi:hypothetical protein
MVLAGLVSPGTALADPPSNANFANATPISSLPFSQTVDLSMATTEPGEPTYTCNTVSQSVWYSFTPTETTSVTARLDVFYYNAFVTVFTGSTLGDLTQVACYGYYYQPLTFRVTAGQTYYLQLANAYPNPNTVRLSLDVAPPVRVDFGWSPSDPSIYDTVNFYDGSYDPGGSLIVSRQWDFGDGGTGSGYYADHRYAVDGYYTVQLTVTTSDGRTGSASQVLHVGTHDVSISRFLVPVSANAGQTRAISVYVRNRLYDETVRVDLYKSAPGSYGGFVQVGSLTQYVASSPNRTVEFPFNYTFTADDAAVGKVTFKAVATLVANRDALPADNEVISTPTRVM